MTSPQTSAPTKSVPLNAPIALAGVLAVGLVGLLVAGSLGVASTLSASPAAVVAAGAEAPPTTTGGEAPVEDPSTPPDRDSDQTEATKLSSTVYIVKSGDTLTSISAMHGVSVDAIAKFNAIKDRNVISSGEHLRIPITYEVP